MTNNAPFNIIMAVGDIYLSPVGTAFPLVNAAPAGPWALLGTAGSLDYDDAGVSVAGTQTITGFTGSASTVMRKVSRTEESLEVTLTLMDMSLEYLRRAFNSAAITTVASSTGIPGSKSIPIYQGADVATFAALIRSYTPYSGDTSAFMQIELPNAYNSSGFQAVFVKGQAVGYSLTLTALLDPANPTTANRLGNIRAYTAAAS
jgi:hypothetical protein